MKELDTARRADPANPASPAPDPLLGWAGLDPAGRVTAVGGALAMDDRLRPGQLLADALVDADGLLSYLESLGATVPTRGQTLQSAAHAVPTRLTARWKDAAAGSGPAPFAPFASFAPFELLLRARSSANGGLRIAAEFWQAGWSAAYPGGADAGPAQGRPVTMERRPELIDAAASLLAPVPIEPGRAAAADVWLLGTALYAATVAPVPGRPVGLIRFALHPVALPRLRAVDDLDPWLAIALERLAVTANGLGVQAVAARTGVRELTVWMHEGGACAQLCEQWLAAVQAAPLIGRERRLVVGPAAAWCVIPADGQVLTFLLDALDAVYEPGGHGPHRPAKPVSSLARERDIDERRGPLTDTLLELARSGRARLAATPIVEAPTGLASGLYLRAEFRSLFAVADLIDYLPDLIEDEEAADVLNAWAAQALTAAPLSQHAGAGLASGGPLWMQLRIAPAQLQRIDSLAEMVAAAQAIEGGAAVCLMLPEAAVHRDAYLVIDAAAEVAALGATLGIDDYRGLLPPAQLAQAGIHHLRLHVSLVRDLDERRFARSRLADLLARARGCGLSVVVAGLIRSAQLDAANAVGALQVAGPLFGRAQRIDGAAGLR